MPSEFVTLLNKHLELSDRFRQPNPEQARAAVQRFIEEINSALDTGTITGQYVRPIAVIAGQWKNILAESAISSIPLTAERAEQLPLIPILRSLSARQWCEIAAALAALLYTAFAAGNYSSKRQYELQLATAAQQSTTQMATAISDMQSQKTRAEKAESKLDAANKLLESIEKPDVALRKGLDDLLLERNLLGLIAQSRDSSNQQGDVARLRQQVNKVVKDMEKAGLVHVTIGQGLERIEIKRAGEVWWVRVDQ